MHETKKKVKAQVNLTLQFKLEKRQYIFLY